MPRPSALVVALGAVLATGCVDLDRYAPLGPLALSALTPLAPRDASTGSTAFALADFDGDGRLDLAYGTTGSAGGLVLRVGLGGDPPVFDAFHSAEPTPGGIEAGLAAQDLDGDGRPEIVLPLVDVFRVAEGGRSEALGAFTSPAVASVAGALGDTDGDGAIELWTQTALGVDPIGVDVRRWRDGHFELQATLPEPLVRNGAEHLLADLDGDGHLDVLVSRMFVPAGVARAGVHWGRSGALPQADAEVIGCEVDSYAEAVADVDGDGIPDLVVSNLGGVTLCRGIGQRRFALPVPIYATPIAGGLAINFWFGDLDRDRKPELVIVDQTIERVMVFSVQPDGAWRKLAEASTPTDLQGRPSSYVFAPPYDLDGDGRVDVAFWTPTGLYALMNASR